MQITNTQIPDVKVLEPEKYEDSRGYFTRLFRDSELANYPIREINRSLSLKKGTIRGLHLQTAPFAQDKIVQCLQGSIFDVAVDMRPDSPTYLEWVAEILTENKMLLVPKGFAHGFQTLEDNVLVQYFVSEYFTPGNEQGYRYNDPKLGILWPCPEVETSEKDANWPLLG